MTIMERLMHCLAVAFIVVLLLVCSCVDGDVASGKTSGKFGFVGDRFPRLDEVNGFPNSRDFFEKYVHTSKPLILRGAATISPAFELWQNDDYFLNQELPEDEGVTVETMKKENRTQETFDLSFKEFLKSYRNTEMYMVNHVPDYLGRDVILPTCLQCPDIYHDSIVDAVIWFSSGGTKSVVHTDSVDNLNCVYYGNKHFVMVDPRKYADKVYFDHPEGAYSDIDVDNVDYARYPSLLAVEYYHVEMEPGDCLFIPYKWIHQVRSDGPRNIAINIWWDTYRNHEVNLAKCSTSVDLELTLDKVTYIGFDGMLQTAETMRDRFQDNTRHMNITFEKYISFYIAPEEMEAMGTPGGLTVPLKQVFKIVDADGDGILTYEEVNKVPDEDWNRILKHFERFEVVMDALNRRLDEQNMRERDQWIDDSRPMKDEL